MRHFRPLLHAYGLTEQQWRVLRVLNEVAEIDATRLSQTTVLLAPSLTRILRDLEARKLIERQRARLDKRASVIRLTAAGRKLLTRRRKRSEAVYERITERIGSTQLEELMTMLQAVETALASVPDDET